MIVVCTNCHAKFRVPDERIGPRGAKVRCSRCTTVFPVRPEQGFAAEGAPPAPSATSGLYEAPRAVLDVDLEPAAAAPAPFGGADPFSTGALALSAAPAAPATEAAANVLSTVPPPLPATSAPSAPAYSPHGDPFAPAAESYVLGPPPGADPFDASWPAGDPGVPQGPGSAPNALPLTDLSDLLGSATPVEIPCPDAVGEPEPPASSPDGDGLSLEERLTPLPLATAAGASGDLFGQLEPSLPGLDAAPPALAAAAASDSFAGAGAFGPMYEGEPLPGEEALALARDTAEPQAASPSVEPSYAVAPEERSRGLPEQATTAERVPRRHVPFRSIAANAVALSALLAIALAMLAVWRSDGPFEIAMLRPSALVAALRTGAPPPPFSAVELRSGVYEREKGPPILFVRGRIVSRAPRPVRGVRVTVEVLRGDLVIASGASLAGAVPTPEELWTAQDAPALERVALAAPGRVPARVNPGDRVPFLVAIVDHPDDLDGATLRLALSPTEGSAP